ncbi:MAG TPA: phosphonate C-P lyase system protein PhnG [Geminicoccaceae bacterium]|nr:phosphonate C-P lyase system protein PhnG [Geminicoccaceae bacterium]
MQQEAFAEQCSERAQRQHWLAVLARAATGELEAFWAQTQPSELVLLRQPEIGLVMARGRAGGTGGRFNLGEITVTRCAVRGADGHIGHGYVAGRDKRKAELVASFDALLQAPERRAALLERVVTPLAAAQASQRASRARKAAATRVEFFTLARGGG